MGETSQHVWGQSLQCELLTDKGWEAALVLRAWDAGVCSTVVCGVVLYRTSASMVPLSFQCNGMSNRFWGWGREDDEFYRRIKGAGLQVRGALCPPRLKLPFSLSLHWVSSCSCPGRDLGKQPFSAPHSSSRHSKFSSSFTEALLSSRFAVPLESQLDMRLSSTCMTQPGGRETRSVLLHRSR